jgi:peptidoglycan/LPS O-acetylase OafA/YrhL
VYPAYWAQLFILLVIALTTSLYTFPTWPDLAAHLFMYFHLPPNWVGPMNGVWWTLPTEFLFYLLLLPLALLLKTRATRVVLLSLVFVAWTYRWWVYETFNAQGPGTMVPLMGNTLGSLDEFIIGTYSAYLYIRHQNRGISPLIASLFLWLGISGVLLTVYSIHWLYGIYWEEGHPLLIVKNTVMGISVVSIIIAIVKGSPPAQRLFANPVMLHIGIISYSLYLWHLPVIHTLSNWSFMVNYEGYLLPIMSAFVLPLSWLVSYSSYRWIERPFLQKRT